MSDGYFNYVFLRVSLNHKTGFVEFIQNLWNQRLSVGTLADTTQYYAR